MMPFIKKLNAIPYFIAALCFIGAGVGCSPAKDEAPAVEPAKPIASETPAPPPVAATPEPAPAPMPTPEAPGSASKTVLARIVVVDMEGNPVPNMIPIATKRPNAFDAPVAQGEVTGADGAGVLSIPTNQWLYVRAWDPAKRLFANNYYDVLPGEGPPAEEMRIMMLPAATLEVEVMTSDGGVAANQFVGMMMSHPTRGPWWPAETETDSVGRARFDSLPPGEYVLTIETRDGSQVDIPATMFLPGKPTRIGQVTVRPKSATPPSAGPPPSLQS